MRSVLGGYIAVQCLGNIRGVNLHLILVFLSDELLESRHITLSWAPEALGESCLPVSIGPDVSQLANELDLLWEPGV